MHFHMIKNCLGGVIVLTLCDVLVGCHDLFEFPESRHCNSHSAMLCVLQGPYLQMGQSPDSVTGKEEM